MSFAEVVETHSGVVFFFGDRAYKAKKPLDLGFLDFRTLDARRAACQREVELNRRLAPDVYLGVAAVTGPSAEICEHLVVMERLPDDRRLATLIGRDEDAERHVSAVARRVATFHAAARRGPEIDEQAGIDATRRRWTDNTNDLIGHVGTIFDDVAVGHVHGLASRYLAGRRALFDRRIAAERAVDGHGDLLADDIFCLADGPRILDCLEFDDALRYGDVLADLAFLAMDLEDLGRADLAQFLLHRYRAETGDSWPTSLEHHHIAYRAQVRAKVTAIRSAQGDAEGAAHARRLLRLALEHLEQGRVRLVLVGGLPGTGKSTLAGGLRRALGASVIHSDVVRKRLAGLAVDEPAAAPFRSGLYSPESTARTYGELMTRAEEALGLGESVVLDASWTDASRRQEARQMAARASADVVELRCVAPIELATDRLRRRTAAHGSDATPEVAAAMSTLAAPWPEAHPVDTSGNIDVAVAEALAQVR